MIKVLILGNGFIGSKLNQTLCAKNLSCQLITQSGLDYKNSRVLSNFIKENSFTHAVNCSGFTGRPNVDACETNKQACWVYNVEVAHTIDTVCNNYNIKCIHVSSGCIYTGYEKNFTEEDEPNFGIYSGVSSFYSKSKHAFETILNKEKSALLRIRMPYTNLREEKNYLYKILKYDNLINFKNSVTSVTDLCNFIFHFIHIHTPGIYNVINPQPISAQEVVEIFKKYKKFNPNWKFIDMNNLNVIANRSNCILSDAKIKSLGLGLTDSYCSIEECIKSL